MEEGRQIEAGNGAQASDKVVRLPRDWLGPREHLVPFGTSAPPMVESEPAGSAPSADDFWGERSAAIHDAVQASEPQPPPSRLRVPRWPVIAAGLMAVVAATALGLLTGGNLRHIAGGTRLNIGALLGHSGSRIDPPRVVPPAQTVKRVRHRSPRAKRAPAAAQHHTSPATASTYVARVTTVPSRRIYHPIVIAPTSPPASSGARVSPTGQSGALGPVHSPNG